jgi:hypothetical protein
MDVQVCVLNISQHECGGATGDVAEGYAHWHEVEVRGQDGDEDADDKGEAQDSFEHGELRWFGGTWCLTGLTGFETPHNPDTLSCAEETGHQRPDQMKAAKTLRRCAGVSFSIALIILATGSTSALKLSVSVLK